MEQSKKRKRGILALAGILVVAILIVAGAFASVYAYRQISQDEANAEEPAPAQVEKQVDIERFDDEKGVLVTYVDPESPAATAGLSRGAIILAVNGQEVNTPSELRQLINEHQAGDTITIVILDGDVEKEQRITLASAGPYLGVNIAGGRGESIMPHFDADILPHEFKPRDFPLDPSFPGDLIPEDLIPKHLDPAIPFGDFEGFEDFDFFHRSTVVISVVPDSPAEEIGVVVGDVITAIDGEEVGDRATVVEILGQKEPGDVVELQLDRAGETMSLSVTLSTHPDEPERAFLGVSLFQAQFTRRFQFEERSG